MGNHLRFDLFSSVKKVCSLDIFVYSSSISQQDVATPLNVFLSLSRGNTEFIREHFVFMPR